MFEPPESTVEVVRLLNSIPAILDVICETTGMGFAAVAHVTDSRWIACRVRDDVQFGLAEGGELDVETTLCHKVRQYREPVVIESVADDPAYSGHHTPRIYGLQSYISYPIFLPDGSFFGTLCAIDARPNTKLKTHATTNIFKLFAEMIGNQIEANMRLERSETALALEKHNTTLREQFIAVLGHDLRNPLASINAGVRMIDSKHMHETGKPIIALIHSSVRRMSILIDNVLDFARGRLGEGVPVERTANIEIRPVLAQVVAEIQGANPERLIISDLADTTIDCDPMRIGQMLSNLLANAVVHGSADGPIKVSSTYINGTFEISVSNEGEKIPDAAMTQLFKPFVRSSLRPSQQGLGLGLYIASEIAKAHGGTLSAQSTPEQTTFSFSMQVE